MSTTQLAQKIEAELQTTEQQASSGSAAGKAPSNRKVWIDLENSPHVPFFRPIIKELEKRGCEVVLTARDCFQVFELADMAGFKYRKIGHHYGKNPIAKLMGLGIRVAQIAPFIVREKPAISVSHGSRSSLMLSALLGIPSINIADYEHADHRLTTLVGSKRKKWVITPEVIPPDVFEKDGILKDHVLHYPGIKEDVYVPLFRPDPSLKDALGIQATDLVVTIRPPATEAHYHNPESDKLLMTVFKLLRAHPEVKAILLPRTHRQEAELRQAEPDLFAAGRMMVPKRAVDGLDLIWYSDLVISGGGTMNREAAALGVRVYSIFRGKIGAVDEYLAQTGRLVLLESPEDVVSKLKFVRRNTNGHPALHDRRTLQTIVDHVSRLVSAHAC